MESIGKQLVSARRSKGLSILDAEEATKIRQKFIEALEKNQFDIISKPVYVKGFIRSYANYLKIDPEPLIKEYKKMEKVETKGEIRAIAPMVRFSTSTTIKPKKLTVSIALLTIIFFMVTFLAYLGYQDTAQNNRFNNSKYAKKDLEKLEKKTNKKKNKITKKEKTKSDLFKIRIRTEKSTWIRIRSGNKIFFRRYVKQGESNTFISRKPLEITAGKGAYVKVYQDGKYKGALSDFSSVASKVYRK